MLKYLTITLVFFASCNLWAQDDLYTPREFKKAYTSGSRSPDGKVSAQYWQNTSKYDIEAEVVPGSWKIKGKQVVTYTNNSPDNLEEIVVKLYPNHYKTGGVRANEIPLVNLTDGMVITQLKVNDESVGLEGNTAVSNLAHATRKETTENKITIEHRSTFLTIELVEPIAPGTTTKLAMSWETEMPSVYVNKIGAYDKESSFMGYWYPQIAVYDDIDGWDKNEYTGAQECYTDFADFKVKIKVPKDNYVFATGDLQNAEQVLAPAEYLAYKKSKTSAEKTLVLGRKKQNRTPAGHNTWVFEAENVRDFAFGVSNNFRWIANSTDVGAKRVSSNIVYDGEDEAYLNDLLNIQEKALQFLSNDLPGVAYPYQEFTTFVGVPEFDGMEFPMMANNGFSKREVSNNLMTFHELAHTYLPHWVGINEVKYSWMEEGWVTFLTIKFCQHLYQGTESENYELNRTMRSYRRSAGRQGDTPLFSPSNYMVIRNMHFQQSYRKPAFMYLALESLLGEEVFKKCLKAYIKRWAEHHPTPYDFMYTFNDVSGQNLNWFWKKWVFDYGYAELAISGLEGTELTVENLGGMPVPLTLKLNYKDGRTQIFKQSPEIWADGNTAVQIDLQDTKDLRSVELLPDAFPDIDHSNNHLDISSR